MALQLERLMGAVSVLEFFVITVYGCYPLSFVGFMEELAEGIDALPSVVPSGRVSVGRRSRTVSPRPAESGASRQPVLRSKRAMKRA